MANRHLRLYVIKSKTIYIWEDGDIHLLFIKKYKWEFPKSTEMKKKDKNSKESINNAEKFPDV